MKKLIILMSLFPGVIISYGEITKEYIAQFLPKNPIVLEAGGHIGSDTKEMSQLWPKGHIYTFEPIPSLFLQLTSKCKNLSNVTCFQLALGSKTGKSIMYISGGSSDASSSLFAPKDHLNQWPTVTFPVTMEVNSITLDEWAEQQGVDHIDFMWLDMQGAELAMLKASPRILKTVKAIYTEVSYTELYEGCPLCAEVKEWLIAQGFVVIQEEIPYNQTGNILFVRVNQ
jgi:FkbM family methyltransferase